MINIIMVVFNQLHFEIVSNAMLNTIKLTHMSSHSQYLQYIFAVHIVETMDLNTWYSDNKRIPL